jgi:hypothetical protein
VPVIPAILWIDGTLSCLRSYSTDDLLELTQTLQAPDYEWQVGEERRGLAGIVYLIGIPVNRSLQVFVNKEKSRVEERFSAVREHDFLPVAESIRL